MVKSHSINGKDTCRSPFNSRLEKVFILVTLRRHPSTLRQPDIISISFLPYVVSFEVAICHQEAPEYPSTQINQRTKLNSMTFKFTYLDQFSNHLED
jgi:hypothetical protein